MALGTGPAAFGFPQRCQPARGVGGDDIVFCEVQPGNRYFCHPIHRIERTYWKKTRQWDKVYTIGNVDRTKVNGTCFFDGIYGKFDWAEH